MNGSFFNAPLSNTAYADLLDSLIRYDNAHPIDSDVLRKSSQKDRKPMEKIDGLPAKDNFQ